MMRTIRFLLTAALLLLAGRGPAAVITNRLALPGSGDLPYVGPVVFDPLSTPVNAAPDLVVRSQVRVQTATNGLLSVDLRPGLYRVQIGQERPFVVDVPSGSASYSLLSRITNAITYVTSTPEFVRRGGDTMTGPLILSGAPTNSLQAATKAYVDSQVGTSNLVQSVAGRIGAVTLTNSDIAGLGQLATSNTLPFSALTSRPTTLAGYGITDAASAAPVQSVAGRTGAVTLTNTDIAGLGQLATSNTLPFAALTARPTTLAGYGITDAASAAPVQSVAGRTGAVTLTNTDIAGLGQLATSNTLPFAALTARPTTLAGYGITDAAGAAPVQSVAGRTGAVTLTNTDVAGLGQLATSNTLPFSALTARPTTLSGYGITDAASAAPVQSVAGRTGTVTLTNTDVAGLGQLATSNTLPFSELTSRPTTLSGYGITDAAALSGATFSGPIRIASGTAVVDAPLDLTQTWNAPAITTTGASGNGTTATITFAAQASAFPVGSIIVVAGVTPSGYNGTYTVTASTTTSVSFASATTGSQTVAGTVRQRMNGIRANFTDTASDATSLLMDLQVGGASQLRFSKTGAITLGNSTIAPTTGTAAIQFGPGSASAGFEINYSSGPSLWFTRGSAAPFFGMATRINGVNSINAILFRSTAPIGWASSTSLTETADLLVWRDGAYALALRDGINAQTLRVYNTITGSDVTASGNWERGFNRWNANVLEIGTEKAGTGVARDIALVRDGTTIAIVNAQGLFLNAASVLKWTGRSAISSGADGVLTVVDNAGTSFNRVTYGGTNASFPAHKRVSATVETRLADDSGFAAVQTLYERFGTGSPEGVVTAPVSTVYHRTDGGAGTSLYVKESGTGNTGWVAK